MEPANDLRPERVGDPLLVLGLVGLFGGIVAAATATVTPDRVDIARSELAAMATRISFLAIALAGTALRARRALRLRPLIVLLGVGLLGLLGFEVHRVWSFDWAMRGEIPSAANAQLVAPVYALAVLAIVDLCWRGRELPAREARTAAIDSIRMVARALIALAGIAIVVLIGAELTRRTDLGLLAAAAGAVASLALISGVLGLVRYGATRRTRWLAAVGAILLTWSTVIHAIHGFLMLRRFQRFREVAPEWLAALGDVAPVVGGLGLIAAVAAVGAMHRGPPEVVSLDRGPYLAVLWLVVASVFACAVQQSLLPTLEPFDESIPLVLALHAVPAALVAPFLLEAARDVERNHAPDLAGARLA